MLAESRNRKFIDVLQALLDIVGIESSVRTHHLHVLMTESEDIGEGAKLYAEVAMIRINLWEERFETLAYSDRTTTRTATAVRCGECLMEIDVHHVEAHIARTAYSEHRVEVSTIIIHQTAAVMHELSDFRDICFEETQCVRVCHHHRSNGVVEQSLEVFHIDDAISSTLHLDNLESADSGRSRVSAVSRVWHDDLGALHLSVGLMISADNHQSGKLTVSASAWLEGEVIETCESREALAQCVVSRECALCSLDRLERVKIIEARHCSHFFIYLRIIFHGAAAERIESIIHAKVVSTMVGVMSYYGLFIDLRQFSLLGTSESSRHFIMSKTVLWKRICTSSFL